jgi:hypothetical protein
MAPFHLKLDSCSSSSSSNNQLQIPGALSSFLLFSPSSTLSSPGTSTPDLEIWSDASLSPRTLYAQSFDRNRISHRPNSSRSLPASRRFRKNMKEITGFGTTGEEFEALPVAVRRKVRSQTHVVLCAVRVLLKWRRLRQGGRV